MATPFEPSIGVKLINGNNIFLWGKSNDLSKVESSWAVGKRLGLVQGVNWSENFEVQPWKSLGVWGNAGFASLGYSLTVNISLFVPLAKGATPDGGQVGVLDFDWTRGAAQLSGKPLIFDELTLKRKVGETEVVAETFVNCMLASQSGNISAGQQVMRNLQIMAVSRKSPAGDAITKKL
ncbi:MAG: hypothetical protein AAF975_03990 [Spirochaetota bacterium]